MKKKKTGRREVGGARRVGLGWVRGGVGEKRGGGRGGGILRA